MHVCPIDLQQAAIYSFHQLVLQSGFRNSIMAEAKFRALSNKIDLLIKHCEQLERDNSALRDVQNNWNQERSQLLQKNDLARNKIEAMIGRLKALEQH